MSVLLLHQSCKFFVFWRAILSFRSMELLGRYSQGNVILICNLHVHPFFMHLLEHLCIWRCWKQCWISWSRHNTLENRIEEGWKSPEEIPNDGIDAVIPNVACAQSAKSCVCSCLLPLNWWYLWKTPKWSMIASIWACICPLPGANSYLSQWCWIPKICFLLESLCIDYDRIVRVSIKLWVLIWIIFTIDQIHQRSYHLLDSILVPFIVARDWY